MKWNYATIRTTPWILHPWLRTQFCTFISCLPFSAFVRCRDYITSIVRMHTSWFGAPRVWIQFNSTYVSKLKEYALVSFRSNVESERMMRKPRKSKKMKFKLAWWCEEKWLQIVIQLICLLFPFPNVNCTVCSFISRRFVLKNEGFLSILSFVHSSTMVWWKKKDVDDRFDESYEYMQHLFKMSRIFE